MDAHTRADLRLIAVPVLQAVILLACIISVTLLGLQGVIDAAAVTAILGAIAGSVGVLAGVNMARRLPPEPTTEVPHGK